MKKLAISILSLAVFTVMAQLGPNMAWAGGVTLYLDLGSDGNYNGVTDGNGLDDYDLITTEPEIAVSSADEVYFAFIPDGEFGIGDELYFTFPSGWSTAACSAPTTDADADQTPDGSFSHGGAAGTSTYTFTAATTIGTTSGTEFCINVTTDASAGNEVVTLSSSSTMPVSSAAFIYNGDDNDVLVTADVQTNLFFAIRNSADDSDTNECALGTLDSSNVSTCAYRLAVATAAVNGFSTYIQDTSSNPGLSANAGADDIDAIVEDVGGTVTAGDEEYGVAFDVATDTSTSTPSEQGDFTDDDTPIPTSKTEMFSVNGPYQYTAGDLTQSSLVTHRASVDANTAEGDYTQTVSYYVTANY